MTGQRSHSLRSPLVLLAVAVVLVSTAVAVVLAGRAGPGRATDGFGEPAVRTLAATADNFAPRSAAAVAPRAAGGVDVFYRSATGLLMQRTFTGTTWSAAGSLGRRIVGAPAAAALGSDVVVVMRGEQNWLNMRLRTGGTWSAWQPLDMVTSAAPAVAAWPDGRIDVIARGTDDRLYLRSLRRTTKLGPWTVLRAAPGSTGPAAFASSNGGLDVLVVGPGHAVLRRTRTAGTWSAWATLGGATYSPPALTGTPGGTLLALIRSTGNQLLSATRVGGVWSAWTSRATPLIDAPAAATGADGTSTIVLRGMGGGFRTRTYCQGVWTLDRAAWQLVADPAPRAALLGTDWTRIPTTDKVVALTFDAGANADGLASIRATLQAKHVPASFFLTGAFVRVFPAEANQISVSGFVTGNHSDTHPYFTQLTDAQVAAQLNTARLAVLRTASAETRPLFRFPYGDVNSRVLLDVNAAGYVAVRWTVDSLGWQGTSGGQTVAKVADRVVAGARPGAIVLMHIGSNPTDHTTLDAAALPGVIDRLRAAGYGFVTLAALTG